ncbi:MAG: type IV pilin protein, partial [Candidatus Avelusimicrobium sp.]
MAFFTEETKMKGFTLIELLVVVLIVGILATAALLQYGKAVAKSRMTQALTWAKSIREAESVY